MKTDLITKIQLLIDNLKDKLQIDDRLAQLTLDSMLQINADITLDFMQAVQRHDSVTARILSRTIYERSVFILFILYNKEEMVSRAQLFYHSSILRQYLWVNYICQKPQNFQKVDLFLKSYAKQNAWCQKNLHQDLLNVIQERITEEREAFNKIECKANYCNLNEFKRDDRRKTWYRVNPDVWGKGTKISGIADVSRLVLNDPNNYCYKLFYGFNSLFTHGYYIDSIDNNNLLSPDRLNVYVKLITGILFGIADSLSEISKLSQKEIQELQLLKQQVKKLFKIKPRLLLPNKSKNIDVVDGQAWSYYQKQVQQTVTAYQFLRSQNRNQSARILLRSLNEQWVGYRWILKQPTKELQQKMFQRLVLTERIQLLKDIRLLAPQNSVQKINRLLIQLNNKYEEMAQEVMSDRTLAKDKAHQRWFAVDKNDNAVSVKTLRSMEQQVLDNGNVYYMYANGFHSVHAHGINLGLSFKLNKKDDVFLLDDVNNMKIADQLVELLTKTEN